MEIEIGESEPEVLAHEFGFLSLEDEAEHAPPIEEPYGDFGSLTQINEFCNKLAIALTFVAVLLITIYLA